MLIRPMVPSDEDAVWRVLEPSIRAGETYALPTDMSQNDALGYWSAPGHEVFVAEERGVLVAGARRRSGDASAAVACFRGQVRGPAFDEAAGASGKRGPVQAHFFAGPGFKRRLK